MTRPAHDAEQTAAHVHAYALFEAVQTDHAGEAAAQIPEALSDAERRCWPEVAFVLAAAQAVHCVARPEAGDPAEAVERLVGRAEAMAAPAPLAVALGLRGIVAAGTGSADRLLDDASTAVALLDDDRQPALDRCAGLVVTAAAFNALQLWELVDELYGRATELQPLCPAPVQAAAVAVNRVLVRLEWALGLMETGAEEEAQHRLAEAAAAVGPARLARLPPLWRLNVDACADVVALLRDATDEDPRAVVARHRDALVSRGDIEVVPLLDAAAALVLWRRGDPEAATEAAERLAAPTSASSGARSFPAWVRAVVLSGGDASRAARAQRDYCTLVARLRWDSRRLMLATARARIEVERRRRDHEQLAHAVRTDPLTGLRNRREFDRWLQQGAARPAVPTALVLVDLDDFKSVNDRFGHDVGDEVLRRVGRLLTTSIRAGDQALRQGGDEFAVVFAGEQLSLDSAVHRAQALRREIADEPWAELTPGLAVTSSVGVAFAPRGDGAGGASPADLYRAADAALYRAKREGSGIASAPAPER